MKIGRYQLENLVREGVRFIFADLRSQEERAHREDPQLTALLATAIALSPEDLRKNLSVNQVPLDAAILLLSQDGTLAEGLLRELENDGFKNVYMIRDGVVGLRL